MSGAAAANVVFMRRQEIALATDALLARILVNEKALPAPLSATFGDDWRKARSPPYAPFQDPRAMAALGGERPFAIAASNSS
jgi:hypothetical protein